MSLAEASSTFPSQKNTSNSNVEAGIRVSRMSHNKETSIDLSKVPSQPSQSGSFFTARNSKQENQL